MSNQEYLLYGVIPIQFDEELWSSGMLLMTDIGLLIGGKTNYEVETLQYPSYSMLWLVRYKLTGSYSTSQASTRGVRKLFRFPIINEVSSKGWILCSLVLLPSTDTKTQR